MAFAGSGGSPSDGGAAESAAARSRLGGFLAVLLIGLPGSGKSTLARALAGCFGMGLLSRERLREAMFPLGHGAPLERRAAFRALALALEMSILLRHPVVVDGLSLARCEDRERLRRLCERFRAPWLEFFLDCPPAVAQARLLARRAAGGGEMSREAVGGVFACAARFDPVEAHVLRLDACQPPAAVAEAAGLCIRDRARELGLLADVPESAG